jgi:hypothetical protein
MSKTFCTKKVDYKILLQFIANCNNYNLLSWKNIKITKFTN